MSKRLAIGDSHIDMYAKFCRITCRVPGATAYGILNADSDTLANLTFTALLSTLQNLRPLICLGEVDCNSTFWLKDLSKKEYVHTAIYNLKTFLSKFNLNFIISSVILPPVEDYQVTKTRLHVKAKKAERSELVNLFNSQLQKMCSKKGWLYLDITTPTADNQGLLKEEFITTNHNSHLNKDAIFPIIREALRSE